MWVALFTGVYFSRPRIFFRFFVGYLILRFRSFLFGPRVLGGRLGLNFVPITGTPAALQGYVMY